MTPPQGRAGDAVAISGTNFGGSVSVSFNGRPAQVLSTNTSGSTVTLLVAVPAGVTTGMVTVTTNGQTVNAGVFTAL
ncbi:MAG: IPT/TIG domain-containing protein [Planctomycetota bacterium]|nr:IPT/TIG domain-containing protein [Planctomycetota bacterium]